MKKTYIYTAIIIFIGLSFILWDFYKINDEVKNDHHYFKSNLNYVNAEKNDICVIRKSSETLVYFKVEGLANDHRICIRYGSKPSSIPKEEMERIVFSSDGNQINFNQRWVSDIFNDENGWQKDISILKQSEFQELMDQNQIYCYRRLRLNSTQQTSGLVFPIYSGIMMGFYLLLLIVLTFNELLSKKTHIVTIISIIATSIFVARIFTGQWFATLFNVFLTKNLITFFLIFWILKKINISYSHYEFGRKEFLKFIYIAIFGFFGEWIGGTVFNYIYFDFFDFNGGMLYEFGKFSNIMGWFKFWIYFAVANFMSNLTFYILDLRKKEKLFKLQKSQETLSSSTLASIQSRINPHFLYNALNSIASLARTEPRKTEEMALELAKFYDQCSSLKSKSLISLSEELNIVKSYLKIEKIRFGDRLLVLLPGENEIPEVMVPSFILQPIVENAIKYGYSSDQNVIHIRITVEINDTLTKLRIYDSGPPFSENMHSGYGINSITKKLKVLFPDRHTISFVNEPEKCVEILLKGIS